MFKRLLVPLDGSSFAEQAIVSAASIAQASGARIELLLVHNGTSYGGVVHGSVAGETEEHIYAQGIALEVARQFALDVSSHVSRGIPAAGIADRARAIDADLIVMTSHGRTGVGRALLGSVADAVIREARVPVLVERPVEGRQWRTQCGVAFRRILIPVDASSRSAAMLPTAIDLCRWLQATPILLRVVAPVTIELSDAGVPIMPPQIVDEDATRFYVNLAQEHLTEMALQLESDARIRAETDVAIGSDPGQAIVDAALRHRADLIAMSTHGRGPSRLLFRSITDKVLRGTSLPLLLLRPSQEIPDKEQGQEPTAESATATYSST